MTARCRLAPRQIEQIGHARPRIESVPGPTVYLNNRGENVGRLRDGTACATAPPAASPPPSRCRA